MKKNVYLLLVILSMFLFSNTGKVAAAPYYQGKTIKILVGSNPGGGYDRLSRVLARHLPKHIPGKPSIIIQNMPGAGSILVTNYLYNVVKPDGLTIGNFERGLLLAQLLKVEGVKYDMRKFAWLGSLATESAVMVMRSDFPFKNFDELRNSKTPIILGCEGPADNASQHAVLLQEFTGLKVTLISYNSGPEMTLALERKEIDGRGGSYTSLKPDIERGLVRPFIRGSASEPGIENLPVDEDKAIDPKGKALLALRSASERAGRPYVAPPGTPAPVMKILSEAFAKVVADPEMLEEIKRVKMRISYLDGQQCLKSVNFVLNQPESMVKEFSKYMTF